MRIQRYEVVGYAGKSGQVRAYKLIGKPVKDKFNEGKMRAHLKSFNGKLDFWVDAEKLTAPPPRSEARERRRSSCACSDGCCDYGCRCGPECNCQGGPIYNC